MAAARVVRGSLRCQNCQLHALNAFASFSGLSLLSARPPARRLITTAVKPQTTYRAPFSRAYATQSDIEKTRSDLSENEVLEELAEQDGEIAEEAGNEPLSSQSAAKPEDPLVPWYLQGNQTPKQSRTGPETQKLPDLPEDSPEKLQAIVEQLFTDIGLDDLYILDLRKMNPPQALGANLIMVFGTARSEKHLHVSADIFCRWLRSTYKMRPYADGLLGRNELKIKLRRKAKRAKLLGGKTTAPSEVDDGIRTGWVCVNVGEIEEGEAVSADELEERGIVGFGEGTQGAHLVVQMMTEEKREELDLEKLWGDALSRQERKEARMARDEVEGVPDINFAAQRGTGRIGVAFAS